jgi:hypothetical protein
MAGLGRRTIPPLQLIDVTGVGARLVKPDSAGGVAEVLGLVAKGRSIRLWVALRRAVILLVV